MITSRLRMSLALAMIVASLFPLVVSVSGAPFTPAATGISLAIDFGNGTIQEFSNLEGPNVYEVTNSTTSVEGNWYGNLVFVTSISGVSENATSGLYWQYWVNGELGGSAANLYLLDDNDSIEWKLPPQNSETTTPPPTEPPIDYSLILGSVVLGAVSILVLIVLWIKQYNE